MIKAQIEEFTEYLREVKKTSENTLISYNRDLIRMADYMEGRGITDVTGITEDRLRDYVAGLKEEQFAASSITRHMTSLKTFFTYLLENGNLSENPAEKLKAPKVEKTEPRVLTQLEIDELFSLDFGDDPKGIRDLAILELMYATGLKTSEIISLKLDNIDMGLGCVRISGDGNGHEDRLIPYGKKAKDALHKYLLEARNELLPEGKECDRVFLNYSGSPLSRQGLWKVIKSYVSKAGIRADVTPFTLRHSFAKQLLDNGADAEAVQEIMGYADNSSISKYLGKKKKQPDPYEWARLRN